MGENGTTSNALIPPSFEKSGKGSFVHLERLEKYAF